MKRLLILSGAIAFVIFCACGTISNNPKGIVSKAINAASKGDVKGLFMQFEDSRGQRALSGLNFFETQYNNKLIRSKTYWTGQKMEPAMIRLFLAPCQSFSIDSVQEMGEEAAVKVKVNYSNIGSTAAPLFVTGFENLVPDPVYSGIRPIFQGTHGQGPLGPIAPDDPALTEGYQRYRSLVLLKTYSIKSVSLEFRLSKIEGKWAIDRITQPFAVDPNWVQVTKDSYGTFEMDCWIPGMETAEKPLTAREVVQKWLIAGQNGDVKTMAYFWGGRNEYYGYFARSSKAFQDTIIQFFRNQFASTKEATIIKEETNKNGVTFIELQIPINGGGIDTMQIDVYTGQFGDNAGFQKIGQAVVKRTRQDWSRVAPIRYSAL